MTELGFLLRHGFITEDEYKIKTNGVQETPREWTFEEKQRAKYDLLVELERRKWAKELKSKQEELDATRQEHADKLKRFENIVLDQKRDLLEVKNMEKKPSFMGKLFGKK